MKSGQDFFYTGPFASASVNQQNFADGLYFAHLFSDSLKERERIKTAHAKAVEEDDLELALARKTELDYLDGIFKLTLEIHGPSDGVES
jgi:hypothetical protein